MIDNLTVIIPIHNIDTETITKLKNAVNSVETAKKKFNGDIITMVVLPDGYDYPSIGYDVKFVTNPGKTDYCSQVNYGVSKVETEWFSICEYDDEYNEFWFKNVQDYFVSHEDYSIFLPINNVINKKSDTFEFMNEIVWASSFSNEIGVIDFDCLENYSFNLTGGVFKTSDWCKYKPSIKVAFNYEYLLRATNKKQKVYVVPKSGYMHIYNHDGSLSLSYINSISESDIRKWFRLARREYLFDEDRNKDIENEIKEELK